VNPNVDLPALLAALGLAGRRVVTIKLVLDDGATVDAGLPVPPAAVAGPEPEPAADAPDPFGDDVDRVLMAYAPGVWVPGRQVAKGLGLDATGGHFPKGMSRLVKAGRIESDNPRGYRIPVPRRDLLPVVHDAAD